MEQTLGKRIAENRKRLGLTQDALAEQLGITAQAVSKWENDQSCPDITMLPKLAEIFGITTDQLLGRDEPTKTYAAEIVDSHDDEEEEDDSGWEFHWDGGKRSAVWTALMVLWIGGLTLASKLLHWDAGFWDILWPSALLFWGLDHFIEDFSIFKLCLVVCGAGYLVSNLGLWTIAVPGELIFPIIIVLFGISLLIDALKKPNKPRFSIHRKGKINHKTKCQCYNKGERFDCQVSFGENNHLVDLPVLAGGEATVSFGELTVDLRGCQRLREVCQIEANCSFGELILLVPRKYRVACESSTAFASVSIKGGPDGQPEGVIELDANISFGQITIFYQ